MKNASTTNQIKIPYSQTHQLKSKINGIEYELFIILPPLYNDTQNNYPTIFTTDPDFILPMLHGIIKSTHSLIPETIIIGIGHADLDFKELDKKSHNMRLQIYRSRDFLPCPLDKSPQYFSHNGPELEAETIKHSGHGPEFKDFITTEVIPFIDKTYRTNKERTLIGHSFGAIFASWMMLDFPTFFQNYLLISPILDFENGHMFGEIINLSKTLPLKFYLCGGSFEALTSSNKNFLIDLEKFYKQINSSPNINGKLEIFEGEYHASNVPFGLAKGLRFLCKL